MKCLKVDEFIEITASVEETRLLHEELQNYVKGRPGPQCRTLCDRVIRACHHHLGVGSLGLDRAGQLVGLVELSLHGYEVSAPLGRSSPLYMEKIIFHIVKTLSSLEAHHLCSRVAGLLYCRLASTQQVEDYHVLVHSCFSVLWNGLSAANDTDALNPRDKLHCQVQALSFLLLSDRNGETPSLPKAGVYARGAIGEFERSCGEMAEEDAAFLLQEIHTLAERFWPGGGSRGDGHQLAIEPSRLHTLHKVVLATSKVLCKAGHHTLAATFLCEMRSRPGRPAEHQGTALVLGKCALKIHSSGLRAEQESCQVLRECTRALRSLPPQLDDSEAHAILEGCGFVAWAVDSGHGKALSGPVLLAWFSFLEQQQEQMLNVLNRNPGCPSEGGRLQQSLCLSIYQGFVFAYESIQDSQLDDEETLRRALLYCQASAGQMMSELRKPSSEGLLAKAVSAVTNLACALFNRRMYEQAFSLVEILCRDLRKDFPTTLAADKLSRPFMLAVQASRRAGRLEQALEWVIAWLKALGDRVTTDMAEPLSLWVKTKVDAARSSEEDVRLRTLRDGFGADVPGEGVMLRLLAEELHAYKEVAGDTAQERYNTLCDLLDICHEGSTHTHLRAVYLCEMAQVVCFQDFSEHTECTAVDFIHEALRLLDEEPETPDNSDRLRDDKAQALLWLYVCTLEKNLQEAMERDRKRREAREQTRLGADPVPTNDLDYEDKQKTQDSNLVYEGLDFSLAAETKLCSPLERALSGWSALLRRGAPPSVRCMKHTCSSVVLTAALFRLMGKPLKALEAYQLAAGASRHLSDTQAGANSLCQSAALLLDLGSPQLALAQLEKAEEILASAPSDGPSSSLSVLTVLLRARYCYSTGQVEAGVPYLSAALKEAGEQRQSKSWYLLRALALQTCSSYLALDAAALPAGQRARIAQHGLKNPDVALYESLKLLSSLVVTLVGNGLYGSGGASSDVRFVDQGDNLVLKWQLLSELLGCSAKMVALRSGCGAVNDARLQCLEALKLASKLQALGQCAELLVVKAELELKMGEREEGSLDLDKVRSLLDLCTDCADQEKKGEVKIKPRKGRPTPRSKPPAPDLDDDDLKALLRTKWMPGEAVTSHLESPPPLKAEAPRWLSCLGHEARCPCPCCSEPILGRVTARWAAAQADLLGRLQLPDAKAGAKLQGVALTRCKALALKVAAKLTKLLPHGGAGSSRPSLMQDVTGSLYLQMAFSALESKHSACGLWKVLDNGLAFVDSEPSPALRPVKAGLMVVKALASLVALAEKRACRPEELFPDAWTWNAPLEGDKKSTPVVKEPRHVSFSDTTEVKLVKSAKPKLPPPPAKGSTPGPVTPKVKSKGRLGLYDFNTAVPTLMCTPVHGAGTPASARRAIRAGPGLPFQVFEESGPEEAPSVPAAPRRTRKSRFKVEFSDESDSEPAEQIPVKKAGARRAAPRPKAAPDPPAEKVRPKGRAGAKKSTALPRAVSSEDDEAPARRGRTTRAQARVEARFADEPDKMRTIDEEENNKVLDISIEQLRTSDTETDNPNVDLEVLRRDSCCNVERDELPELRLRSQPGDPQTSVAPPDTRPDDISLEAVQSSLRSAWLALQHFPPPALFPAVASLLALSTGQREPVTTAMLHAQSLGIASRHRAVRHLASCLKKQRKAAAELADQMDTLSLEDGGGGGGGVSTLERLSQLEDVFSFPAADSSAFPRSHCQEFSQLIQRLPPGVTVCVMSTVGVKTREMGNSILLSRLERGAAPITVHIPTSREQRSISWLVGEMESVQAEQKVVSCVLDKAGWWEGRRALDARVKELLKALEGLLGCWKSLLLPLSSDPKLCAQASSLRQALTARGADISEEILKVLLSASSPVLSSKDLRRFCLGVSPRWDKECNQLLHAALSQFTDPEEPRGHVVLVLDKYLQKLPWESISTLRSRSVSRMPSLHSIIGMAVQKECDPRSILKHGVDAKQVFYVLDPDANLANSQAQFRDWFCSNPDWAGVCGVAPDSGQLEAAVATKDLYIYIGHGAGVRFLDSQTVLKRPLRAACLLLGCSSAALAVRGEQEGHGIILSYLIAGCPFVLGNLWDVTDRDIDRFTKALLEGWLTSGPGGPLLECMGPSRQATNLKHLVGAAPVVYGLPVHLQ